MDKWYHKALYKLSTQITENPELYREFYGSDCWIEFCKHYPKWDNRDTIEILEDKVKSLKEELEYYKTPYYKRFLNKIKPLLDIRFKVVMYSKD